MFYPKERTRIRVQSDIAKYPLDRVTLGIFSVSPSAKAVADVLAATALLAAETTISTGFTDPDVPRNVRLTLTETAADVAAVQGVVNGTDMAGNVIAETMPVFTENTLGTVVGSKVFATVTSIVIPAMDGAGVEISVGSGDLIGIPAIPISAALKPVQVSATAITITADLTNLNGNNFTLDAGEFDDSEHEVLLYLS